MNLCTYVIVLSALVISSSYGLRCMYQVNVTDLPVEKYLILVEGHASKSVPCPISNTTHVDFRSVFSHRYDMLVQDNQVLSPYVDILSYDNNTITFKNFTKLRDMGIYRCTNATNRHYMYVLQTDFFKSRTYNRNYYEGQSVDIKCEPENPRFPENPYFGSWIHVDTDNIIRAMRHKLSFPDARLNIKRISYSDTGMYVCETPIRNIFAFNITVFNSSTMWNRPDAPVSALLT